MNNGRDRHERAAIGQMLLLTDPKLERSEYKRKEIANRVVQKIRDSAVEEVMRKLKTQAEDDAKAERYPLPPQDPVGELAARFVGALDVECPYCSVPPKVRCLTPDSGTMWNGVHQSRFAKAQALGEGEAKDEAEAYTANVGDIAAVLAVSCPFCKMPAGEKCIEREGVTMHHSYHQSRFAKADKMRSEG